MAEGILRNMAGDKFEVFSAGTHPKGLHPQSVAAMKDVGIDISNQTSKEVSHYAGQSFDFVITVCDRAKEHCPVFPGAASIHWSFEDPAEASPENQPETFHFVRDQIADRVRQFVLVTS
jgi:arsenate reductase